jgi:hypothetical protein
MPPALQVMLGTIMSENSTFICYYSCGKWLMTTPNVMYSATAAVHICG